jgi:hypothetical protein
MMELQKKTVNFHAKKNFFADRSNKNKRGIIPANYFEYIVNEDLMQEVAALNGEVIKKKAGSRFDAVQRKGAKRKVTSRPASLLGNLKLAIARNA